MTAPLMQITGLDAWQGSKQVLRQISLSLPRTGCTVLMGPSGTGKSTLLKCLFALSRSGEQAISIAGFEVRCAEVAPRQPLLTRQVPQKPVRPSSTVLQFFQQDTGLDAASLLQQARHFLLEMGCETLARQLLKPCEQIGQRDWIQLCLLQAAFTQPPLLLLDEPAVGLSDEDAEQVLDLVVRLAADTSVVMVTHHQGEARRVGDQIILLGDGQLQEASSAETFFTAPQSEAGRYFLGHGTLPEVGSAAVRESDEVQQRFDDVLVTLQAGRVPSGGKQHALQPKGFYWVVPGLLAGTPLPGLIRDTAEELKGLSACGVDTLLNLTESAFVSSALGPSGLKSCWEPILDMTPPTMEQAIDLCALLDRKMAEGHCVAVHCKAGLGRTGTILAMYLMWRAKGAWSGEVALRSIRRINPMWVQSEAQIKFLEDFGQFLNENVTFA